MTCPLCFFKKTTQRELKDKCLKSGIDRFEDRLKEYKKLFITELSEMKTVSECHCKEELNIQNSVNLQWFDDFREKLVSKKSSIEEIFDELSRCYHHFLEGNPRKAHCSLWQFIRKSKLMNQDVLVGKLLNGKLLFRGRKVQEPINKKLKNTDLFHIPFNKRELVSHGRFSVSGQPMLYCGFSSFIVAKELDAAIDELAMIAFLPKKPLALGKIFGLTSIHETFSNIICPLLQEEVSIAYNNDTLDPSVATLDRDIKQTILLELCTFPRPHQKEDKFTAEYMLPQMLSSVLMSKGYKGIIYPSTKDCSDLTGVHTFSRYDLNVALFVDYHSEKMHDEKLLDFFETALYPHCKESEIPDVSIAIVEQQLDVYAKSHYEYLRDSELKGTQKKYFETPFGKTELALHKNILGWGDHRIQILRNAEDRPLFAVIPFAQYQASQKKLNNTLELDIPAVIVNLALENDYSAARAWREHLKLTQEEVAKRMEITQDAYAQLEAKETVRKSSREKIAKALGIHESQLDF